MRHAKQADATQANHVRGTGGKATSRRAVFLFFGKKIAILAPFRLQFARF